MRERGPYPESVEISTNAKPGEFVLQTLYAEFAVLAAKKIELVLEPTVSTNIQNITSLNNLFISMCTIF